ncbi:hypothetical protein SDC9_153637 [bioreactor metagenome]|uniref:Uncharacterized protein n=1 Tax=bioreactor metagenome TaxID=1076179 RepID=A0A645EWG9_9ZZZZ
MINPTRSKQPLFQHIYQLADELLRANERFTKRWSAKPPR